MNTDEEEGVNFGSKHISVIIRAIRGSYSCIDPIERVWDLHFTRKWYCSVGSAWMNKRGQGAPV